MSWFTLLWLFPLVTSTWGIVKHELDERRARKRSERRSHLMVYLLLTRECSPHQDRLIEYLLSKPSWVWARSKEKNPPPGFLTLEQQNLLCFLHKLGVRV